MTLTRPPCSTTNWRSRSPGGEVTKTGASKSPTLRSRTPRAAAGVAVASGVPVAGAPASGVGRPAASSPPPPHATPITTRSTSAARVIPAITSEDATAAPASRLHRRLERPAVRLRGDADRGAQMEPQQRGAAEARLVGDRLDGQIADL